jgi:hypothetical protein
VLIILVLASLLAVGFEAVVLENSDFFSIAMADSPEIFDFVLTPCLTASSVPNPGRLQINFYCKEIKALSKMGDF